MHQEKASQHPKLNATYIIASLPNVGLGKETGDLAIDNVSSHYIPCSRTACTVHRTQ